MTLLVASIAEKSLGAIRTRAEEAFRAGADAVEVRIDSYGGNTTEVAAYLKENSQRTWIVTCRSSDEGGFDDGVADRRAAKLVSASAGTNAYVDFELADWRRCEDIHEALRVASAKTDGIGHRLILSAHDFSGVPSDLSETVAHMIKEGGYEVEGGAYSEASEREILDGVAKLVKTIRR